MHYVVRSISEIQCVTKVLNRRETTMACTPVETLFNGAEPPSETGVRWLLNTIYRYNYPIRTRFHTLSIELQDTILDYAFESPRHNVISRATFAAQLNIGTPSGFKKHNSPFKTSKFDIST